VVAKVQQIVAEQISPVADLRGSEWYKRRMAGVFVKKVVEQLDGAQG
jgi:CO/xanthine dehydrogenase FAD-binding subunit